MVRQILAKVLAVSVLLIMLGGSVALADGQGDQGGGGQGDQGGGGGYAAPEFDLGAAGAAAAILAGGTVLLARRRRRS